MKLQGSACIALGTAATVALFLTSSPTARGLLTRASTRPQLGPSLHLSDFIDQRGSTARVAFVRDGGEDGFARQNHGVSNAQTIALKLTGINDRAATTDYVIPMGVILADANGDGAVNSSDATVCKSRSGSTTDSTNFRADFNLDGSINSADTSIAKSRSGTGL